MAKSTPTMASAGDNEGIPPMPALPPMGGFASHLSGHELPRFFIGQSSSQGAAAGTQNTPSPYHISVRHSDEPSTISGLTAPNTANTSADNSKRISAHSDSSDDDEPSPKKALPDFSLHKSEEDSVASGDDSEGWDGIEERLAHDLIARARIDDALDEAAFSGGGKDARPCNNQLHHDDDG
jgi:hypothetical protein